MRKVEMQPLHSHQLCSDPPPIWSKPCRPLGTGCVPLGRVAKNKPTAEEGRHQGTISQNQATVRTPARTASTAKIPLNPQQSQSSCPHSVHGPRGHSPTSNIPLLMHSSQDSLTSITTLKYWGVDATKRLFLSCVTVYCECRSLFRTRQQGRGRFVTWV